MIELLLAAQLTITTSSPPLTPAEAAAVLLKASPDRNVSRVYIPPAEPEGLLPIAARSTYRPGDGPFGRFAQQKLPPYPPTTPWVHVGQAFTPVIDVRIIEPRGYAHHGREPITGP